MKSRIAASLLLFFIRTTDSCMRGRKDKTERERERERERGRKKEWKEEGKHIRMRNSVVERFELMR